MDGGLERLIHILRHPPRTSTSALSLERGSASMAEMQSNWKWSLAFQCVVNIGVRGSEAIRSRVVEAGMVPIVMMVLQNYITTAEQLHMHQSLVNSRQMHASMFPFGLRRTIYPQLRTAPTAPPPAIPMETDAVAPTENAYWNTDAEMSNAVQDTQRITSDASASGSASECAEDNDMMTEEAHACSSAEADLEAKGDANPAPQETPRVQHRSSAPEADRVPVMDASETPRARQPDLTSTAAETAWSTSFPTMRTSPLVPLPVYREEEVLLSLQLLAYLSKYPQVRHFFHNADIREDMIYCPEWPEDTLPNRSWQPSDPVILNVFSLAERFTHRPSRSTGAPSVLCSLYPRLAHDIQYWAGVVMRNACRKDESRGGIRQCANMLCGKWESYPREFAKCRRCRKAKYCSKQCQSKGWQMGHRFWCSARSDEDKARPSDAHAASHSVPPVAPEAHPSVPAPTLAHESVVEERAPGTTPTHYAHPLGPRNVPSSLRESQLPQLRGVSATSMESADLAEIHDETSHLGETSGITSPMMGSGPSHPLPPPIIAGDITVHETDPTTATLRAHEAQNVQDHSALDFVASAWSPVVSRATEMAAAGALPPGDAPFDLGIQLPLGSPNGPVDRRAMPPVETGPSPLTLPVALREAGHPTRALSVVLTNPRATSTPTLSHPNDEGPSPASTHPMFSTFLSHNIDTTPSSDAW